MILTSSSGLQLYYLDACCVEPFEILIHLNCLYNFSLAIAWLPLVYVTNCPSNPDRLIFTNNHCSTVVVTNLFSSSLWTTTRFMYVTTYQWILSLSINHLFGFIVPHSLLVLSSLSIVINLFWVVVNNFHSCRIFLPIHAYSLYSPRTVCG